MSDEELQIACFNVGDVRFGADIMEIKEIIRFQKVTKVPRAPGFIEGVITIRGEAVPVIDMRSRLGLETQEPTRDTRIIIVRVESKDVGITVDSVSRVMKVSSSEILPAPGLVKGVESEYLRGVVEDGEDVVLILEMNRVLTSTERLHFAEIGDASEISKENEEARRT